MSDSYPVSERTRLRRRPQRGSYDRGTVHAILDEGFVCHLGFVDAGHVYVVPTGYVRVDDHVYVHAASAGRIAQSLSAGLDVCLTVTLLDGLVLARSAFHHSMNYRSVVAFGRARLVHDPAEKINALRHFTNHIAPGRWNGPPTDRSRAERDDGDRAPSGERVGQDPDGATDRRRRGPCAAGLGWGHPTQPDSR